MQHVLEMQRATLKKAFLAGSSDRCYNFSSLRITGDRKNDVELSE